MKVKRVHFDQTRYFRSRTAPKNAVGHFHTYWENSHPFQRTKDIQRCHRVNSEKGFLQENLKKRLKIFGRSHCTEKKRKWPSMLAKRFAPATLRLKEFSKNRKVLKNWKGKFLSLVRYPPSYSWFSDTTRTGNKLITKPSDSDQLSEKKSLS